MTTVREVLFGDRATAAEAAARRLVDVAAVPAGPAAARIARAVVDKIGDLLDIELSDVLVGAWRTGSDLLEAARRTRAEPGTSREVTVRTYEFAWDNENDLDITLNRSTVAALTVLATVQVEVTALAATVHDGRISRLHTGDLDLSADVRCRPTVGLAASVVNPSLASGLILAQGSRRLDLRSELRLPGQGLPLL